MRQAEIRRDEEEKAVSPVIATILMVAITVVLAGVLYVWANNLASEGTDTSVGTLNTYTTEDADDETGPGAEDTLVKMQMTGKDDLAWSFIKITLSVGDNVYTCSVVAGDDCQISQAAGDNDNAWEPGEYLFLSEGDEDICSEAECLLQISVTHNGRTVAGDGVSGQGGNVGSGSVGGTTTQPPANPTPTFAAHNVSTSADRGTGVHAADMDGDGDMDIISASWGLIAWHENDGSESFTTHTISTSAQHKPHVYAVDLDQDGDMDVVSTSYGTIRWHENDGTESFTTHTISNANSGYGSVHAEDMDGDGDMDVLSISGNYGGKVFWHENDGSESFTDRTISSSASNAGSVFGLDMDNDGDMDVLASAYGKIVWFENDGTQSFTTQSIVVDSNNGETWAYPADLDGDGDMDVIGAEGHYINWYENDGNQNFVMAGINDGGREHKSVFAVDFDNDGDLDILASQSIDAIVWLENDGSENFVGHIIISAYDDDYFQLGTVHAEDIDGDGDMDALSVSHGADIVAWYENDLI